MKPEHRQHRKIGPLSDFDYRLWVGMICEADDEGRLVADADQLRVLVFGYHHKVHSEHVEQAMERLATLGLIRLYPIGIIRYADFPSWMDHQRINRPTPSRLPTYESSLNAHGILTESSLTTHAGSEGIGRDRRGELSTSRSTSHPLNGHRDEAKDVIEWLNKKTGHNFPPNDTNLKLVEARLRDGVKDWQLKRIVTLKVEQWAGDPKMFPYLRPKTLFNATNVANYLGELPKPPESV